MHIGGAGGGGGGKEVVHGKWEHQCVVVHSSADILSVVSMGPRRELFNSVLCEPCEHSQANSDASAPTWHYWGWDDADWCASCVTCCAAVRALQANPRQ
jgi:hypothetical protein